MAQRKALGRGLSALLGAPDIEPGDQLTEIEIERIVPNSNQPRKEFAEPALDELAASIREHGLVQPVLVRPLNDGFYQLIAGERRWRASQRAGLARLPAVVREAGDVEALEMALIENLQREDLNPIEEAEAYRRLVDEFGMTQDEVARRVGKNRTTVANILRLLRLPLEVQQWLRENRLTTGHAKALLSLSDLGAILESAKKMIEGSYSVRQAEMLVSRYPNGSSAGEDSVDRAVVDPNIRAAIDALEQVIGGKVTVQERGGKGKIELHFYSFDEMNRLYDGLMRTKF